MNSLIKKPSAWIPIVLSLIVIILWCITFATVGVPKPEPDEGTAAHLFQIWLALETLMIAFFAIKWLPRAPKQALLILAIQILLVIAGCAPVFYLGL